MPEPTREEIEGWRGTTVLEFGASWCPICQAARPLIDRALGQVHHVWIEDGRGQPLGRSFGVKLWPTLVVLRDGKEVARVVRPRRAEDVTSAIAQAA